MKSTLNEMKSSKRMARIAYGNNHIIWLLNYFIYKQIWLNDLIESNINEWINLNWSNEKNPERWQLAGEMIDIVGNAAKNPEESWRIPTRIHHAALPTRNKNNQLLYYWLFDYFVIVIIIDIIQLWIGFDLIWIKL